MLGQVVPAESQVLVRAYQWSFAIATPLLSCGASMKWSETKSELAYSADVTPTQRQIRSAYRKLKDELQAPIDPEVSIIKTQRKI